MPQTTMRSLKLIGENSTPTNTSPDLGAAGSGTSRSSIPSTASPYFTTWTALIAIPADVLSERQARLRRKSRSARQQPPSTLRRVRPQGPGWVDGGLSAIGPGTAAVGG